MEKQDQEIGEGTVQPKVKSLYKALRLLDYFDQDHREAGVTELAEYSGLLKSTVHNILQTFEICGFVTQNVETSKYMLGGAAVSLFSRYRQTRNLDYRITVYMQEFRSRCHMNVYFGEKQNHEAVYLLAEQAYYDSRDYLSKEGARVPLHCTAVGKILLGYSRIAEKEAFYRLPLTQYTEHTITDPEELKAQMETIIYQGYAKEDEEYREGAFGLAVPILVGDQAVRYAIGVTTEDRMERYLEQICLSSLQDMARKIAGILSEK